jgi:hypothetical protein
MCDVKYVTKIEKWEKKTKRKRSEGTGRRDDGKEGDGGRQADVTEMRYLYRVSHPVQMLPSFVPKYLYRFNNRYK